MRSQSTRCGVFLALAFGIFGGAVPATPQSVTSIEGTIHDPTGAVVPGAHVVLTNEATSTNRTVQSGAQGEYIFPELAPGQYTLRVQAPGFKTVVHEHLQALVATPVHLDITLELGTTGETVTVTAEAGAVNTENATVGLPYSELEIKQLPFAARNPVDLLTLEPGVVFSGRSDTDNLFQGSTKNLDFREGVVNGVRGDQSNVTLDGVDVNDFQNQAAFTSALPMSLDSIKEFRVITTNSDATGGTAGGAQVAIVTKSGSNDLHGNLRWFHRNTKTAANSFFNNKSGVDRPNLIRNIGGVSLGGPLVKDRVFFFGDWERRTDRSAENVTQIVPSDALRQGTLTYEVDQTVPGFNPSAPGVIPCPNNPGRLCQQLAPARIAALDPGCSNVPSPGCGVNPAMLAFMNLYPKGNDPSQGLDAGLNFTGFRFNAPIGITNNIYATRLDFNLTHDGRHAVFFRGNYADINNDILPQQFPGQPAASKLFNNSKGFVLGYTAQLRPTLISDFHWAFTRLGISQSGASGASFGAESFSDILNFTRPFGRTVPIHELKEDLTWTRGRHLIQAGVDARWRREDSFSGGPAFPDFRLRSAFCNNNCRDPFFALTGDSDPNNDPVNVNAFTRAFLELTGTVTEANATFLIDPKTRAFLPAGSIQKRRFGENDFEWYFQDAWRLRSNLTATLGLRYSYFGPVWERNGAQTRPTVDLLDWFNQRVKDMNSGIPSDASPLLQFEQAGKANGKDSWYQPDTNNLAPRVSVAYSPGFNSGILGKVFGGPGKSSIRAGAGMYYQQMGGPLALGQTILGDPGLTNFIDSPVFKFGLANGPRFSGTCSAGGCSGLPSLNDFINIPTSVSFPFVPDTFVDHFNILIDRRLQNPYTINLNLSFEREVAKNTTLELGYVGVLGHQLLVKSDLAQYYGLLKDSASGQTLWGATNQLIDKLGPDVFNPVTPVSQVQPVAFFENLLPGLANSFASNCDPSLITSTATQGMYCLIRQNAPDFGSDIYFLLDVLLPAFGSSPWNTQIDPQRDGLVLFQPQFETAPTWVNLGTSNYHSFQISLRRKAGDFQYGFNYVLSKSFDNGSASPSGDGVAFQNGQIPNAFLPQAHRAFSDFDVRHNFSASWVAPLPFGKGKAIGRQVSGKMNHLIGDWEITGNWRWHSGFPLSPRNGINFPTNFFQQGPATVIGKLESSVTKRDPSGVPNLFSDPAAARLLLAFTRPGSVGSRNVIRGDQFFRVDLAIAKTFHMPWEGHTLQFRAEFFNAFNSVNFSDTASQFSTVFAGSSAPNEGFDIDNVATFGRLFTTAGPRGGARDVEFALRYTF